MLDRIAVFLTGVEIRNNLKELAEALVLSVFPTELIKLENTTNTDEVIKIIHSLYNKLHLASVINPEAVLRRLNLMESKPIVTNNITKLLKHRVLFFAGRLCGNKLLREIWVKEILNYLSSSNHRKTYAAYTTIYMTDNLTKSTLQLLIDPLDDKIIWDFKSMDRIINEVANNFREPWYTV